MPPLLKPSLIIFFIAFILFTGCKKNATVPALSKTPQPPPTIPSNPTPDPGLYTITEVGDGLYSLPDFSTSINGYTDKLTYQPGDSVSLYISGPRNNHQVIALTDVNDKVVFSVNTPIDLQTINTQKPWVDGLMFKKTIEIKLPDNLKSGIYRWFGKAPIVCTDKSYIHDITVVYPTNTDNAYNLAGGKSLYYPNNGRSTVASFLRFQYAVGDYSSSFLRWVSKQSYDINYISDADLDYSYDAIQNSKLVIIVGHNEYWTRQERVNIDKFVESGKNVLYLCGNTMYYQVRYNRSKNIMICYKDKNIDPLGNTIYSTTFWTDQILKYPVDASIGVDYIHGGLGNQLTNSFNGYKITNANSPLFEGTGLKNGDILSLPTVEYDCAPVVKMILPGSTEIPIIDNTVLKFYKIELLGYNFSVNFGQPGLGTFIVFKKKQNSGTVVNVASTNWCASSGINGVDKTKIQTITKNMIDKSLSNRTLFSQ